MNEEVKAEAAKVSITGEKPAAGYDDWFRTKVKKSIDDTDKGAEIYPADEVWNALGLDD